MYRNFQLASHTYPNQRNPQAANFLLFAANCNGFAMAFQSYALISLPSIKFKKARLAMRLPPGVG